MSKPHKPIGRPRGSSRQSVARELIAQGVAPVEAFARAGFKCPGREVKRRAGAVAEAQGKSPLEVLEQVARYGSPADAVSACAAILAVCGDEPADGNESGTTLHVRWVAVTV